MSEDEDLIERGLRRMMPPEVDVEEKLNEMLDD